jgi:hypothetical protein
VPRLCEFYPGIYLTTVEKTWKNLSQGKKNLSQVNKNLRLKKKPQSVYCILYICAHPTHFGITDGKKFRRVDPSHTMYVPLLIKNAPNCSASYYVRTDSWSGRQI